MTNDWKPTPAEAALAAALSALLLGLYTYWFAVADRYYVFLYNHLGAQPFDAVTQGRYWMTGLVAGGLAAVGYGIVNWYLARLAALRRARWQPPAWQHLWAWCAFPVGAGIFIITTTCNQPVLPPVLAAQVVLAAEASLALALYLGTQSAQALGKLAAMLGAGLGLVPTLMFLRAVELPARGVHMPVNPYLLAAASVAGGGLWLAVALGLARWRGLRLSFSDILAGGAGWSYLLLPLAHFALFTPPQYRYISAASNFFAFDGRVQAVSLGLAIGLAWLTTRLTLGGHHA